MIVAGQKTQRDSTCHDLGYVPIELKASSEYLWE